MSTSTPPPPQHSHATRPPGASFFAWLRSLGVTRRDDAWIAGVCSGVAARTGLDPMLVRGIAIVVAVLGGPIFLAYAVGWALLPDSQGRIHAERALAGEFTPPMVFIGIAAILTFVPFTRGLWFQGTPIGWGMPDWLEATLRGLWILALVAGAIWLIVVVARRAPRAPSGTVPPGGQPGAQPGTAGDQGAAPDAAAGSRGYAATAAPYSSAPYFSAPYSSAAGYPATGSPAAGAHPGAPAQTAPDLSAGTAGAAATDASDQTGATGAASGPYADPYARLGASASAWANDWRATHSGHAAARAQAREQRLRAVEDAKARAAAWGAAHPHPDGVGAAFASIVLGLALVAGAMIGVFGGFFTTGGKFVLVMSIAALAVISVGIIIAGVRGRRSGVLSPFALLLAIVVIFTGIVPSGAEVRLFGTQNVDAREAVTGSYLMIAGKSVVDARNITRTSSPGGSTDVWLGFGETEVLIPDDVPLTIESHVFGGSVTSRTGTIRSGVWIDDTRLFTGSDPSGRVPDQPSNQVSQAYLTDLPVIRLWLLGGTVKLVPENAR